MKYRHRNLKRIAHRISEEIIATKRIAKVTSRTDAFATLMAKVDIQIMNHNGYNESSRIKKHLMKKHEVMLDYFEVEFSEFEKKYDYEKAVLGGVPKLCDCIWICWWQGLEEAPSIVKKCVESVKRNAGEHRVIVITEENYKKYVRFPEWIEEKKDKGIISRTHYSDLLRLELLSQYGGVWLDSTFFCVKPEIETYFKLPIWSVKRPDYGHCSVACGYFANYSLGCNYENRWVFSIIRDFVFQYWKTNDFMIDYLFLDYIIVFIQRHNKEFAKVFAGIEPNNPHCDELFKVLGNIYDKDMWEQLKKNTALFKLTWKKSFPKQKKGKETFYIKLLKGEL